MRLSSDHLAGHCNRDDQQRLSPWNRPHIRHARSRVVCQTLQDAACAFREDKHHVRPDVIPILALRGLLVLGMIEVCADFSHQHVGDPYPIDRRCFPLCDILEPLNDRQVGTTSLVATSFGDLNQLLVELVGGAKEVLADNFCGAYLQGSFAVGDADAHSDVDFIIVTKDEVTPKQEAELQTLHQALYAQPTPWAQHLEGSYIPREVLRRPDPARRPLLYLDNGATAFRLDNHDNTVVVRWSLRERGVVLAGPDPRELVDPITADELRAEVRWALGHWRAWFRSVASINRRA